jgi:hypothetical protein
MNSFAADAVFVLLGLVVMVAIWAILALISFARRAWPTSRGVDKLQQSKLHQRLEQITNQTEQAKRSA